MTQEFEKSTTRPEFPLPEPMPFPENGSTDDAILEEVLERLSLNPYKPEKNFGVSYVGPPHPISERVRNLSAGTFFVEWAQDLQPGTYLLEKEAVRMLASLLGCPSAAGFITSGGTESNISALRLARNLWKVNNPEVIMPESAHYSFRLGAELLGIQLREVPVGEDFIPDMNQVEQLINHNTIALVCSAPEGNFGILDPIEDFSSLAKDKKLFLHVDGAFGGFILPFMKALKRDVPPFDFKLPGVSSFMTDGHKLGLMPVATGFLLVRDEEMLQAIPTEETVVHNITATKPGDHAAIAWAVMQRLGKNGYIESTRNVLSVVDLVAKGIREINGLRLMVIPSMTIVTFTSDIYDVGQIHQELKARGWGSTYGIIRGVPRIRLSIHPHRDKEHAQQLLMALKECVAICSQ